MYRRCSSDGGCFGEAVSTRTGAGRVVGVGAAVGTGLGWEVGWVSGGAIVSITIGSEGAWAASMGDAAAEVTAYMDTLVVALGRSGDEQAARDMAIRALQIARARGLSKLVEKLQARLDKNDFSGE